MSIQIAGCTITIARSDKEFDAVFGIRHKIYCEDLGYEPTRADKRECDQDDMRAIHLLATDEDKAPIGTVRIILPNSLDKHPFKKAYAAEQVRIPYNYISTNDNRPPESMVLYPAEHHFHTQRSSEISRLSVLKKPPQSRIRSGLNPSLLLLMAATVVNANVRLDGGSSLTGAYFLTTQSIISMATKCGVKGFQQIAPEINHHGKRAAYWIRTERAAHSLSKAFTTLYGLVQEGIKADMTQGEKASVYWMAADTPKRLRKSKEFVL